MNILIDSEGNSGRSNKSSDGDEKLSVQCGISEKESKYHLQFHSNFLLSLYYCVLSCRDQEDFNHSKTCEAVAIPSVERGLETRLRLLEETVARGERQ